MLRHKGKWFNIHAKPYEPERQTNQISWIQIRDGMSPDKAYRTYFEKQRKDAKILYPSFRKDDN